MNMGLPANPSPAFSGGGSASSSSSPSSTVNRPPAAVLTTFVGVYKHGLRSACLLELELLGGEVVCENVVHDLVVFRLDLSTLGRSSGRINVGGESERTNGEEELLLEDLPLSFDILFEPIAATGESSDTVALTSELPPPQSFDTTTTADEGGVPPCVAKYFKQAPHHDVETYQKVGQNKNFPQRKRKDSEAAKAEAATVLAAFLRENKEAFRREICRPWRATCEKVGEFGVKSGDVCREFGELATALLPDRTEEEKAKSVVSMKNYEMEVVLFMSHKKGDEGGKGLASVEKGSSQSGGETGAGSAGGGGRENCTSLSCDSTALSESAWVVPAADSTATSTVPSTGITRCSSETGRWCDADGTAAWLRRKDELARTAGRGLSDLWSVGIRHRRKTRLLAREGEEQSSGTNVAVAASLGLMLLHRGLGPEFFYAANRDTTGLATTMTLLDPMCGNGTLPMVFEALRRRYDLLGSRKTESARCCNGANADPSSGRQENGHVAKMRKVSAEPLGNDDPANLMEPGTSSAPAVGRKSRLSSSRVSALNFHVLGADTKSLDYAQQLASQASLREMSPQTSCGTVNFAFLSHCDTRRLPVRTGSVDLILVDPPWGQRHGRFTGIQKNWRKWKGEWLRVLRVGGLLGVVTIRTKHVLQEYEDWFGTDKYSRGTAVSTGANDHATARTGCELLYAKTLNNAGYVQCQFFLFRKTEVK